MVAKSKKEVSEGTLPEETCPHCGSTDFVHDYQESSLLCGECGFVVRERIKDRGPEWRAYGQEEWEEKSRAGPPTTETRHDKGLSTYIDHRNRDAQGKSLSPERRSEMYRLRKWQKRTKFSGSKDRGLVSGLSEIQRVSSQLNLPEAAQEGASKIYREASEKDFIRGRSIEGVVSGILYVWIRENELPRTLDEIAEVSPVGKKEIFGNYRDICRELDIHPLPDNPVEYIPRLGDELGLSNEPIWEAKRITKKAEEKNLTSGKSRMGTAGAALYIAGLKYGERRTQREVAEVADVTEVTVRNRYKEFEEELDLDVQP